VVTVWLVFLGLPLVVRAVRLMGQNRAPQVGPAAVARRSVRLSAPDASTAHASPGVAHASGGRTMLSLALRSLFPAAILMLALAVDAGTAAAETVSGRIVGIADGDTLTTSIAPTSSTGFA